MPPSGRFGVLVCICWLFTGAPSGFAQAPTKPEGPKVVAYATATVSVKPDAARLTFAITTTIEGNEKSAREAHEQQVKRVKDALVAIPKDQLKLDVSVVPTSAANLVTPQPNPGTVPPVVGRRAQSTIQVTVREKDLEKLKDAVSRLSETIANNGGAAIATEESRSSFRMPRRFGGGNEEETEAVNGAAIEWLADDTSAARREAIKRAIQEARTDAEAAAGTNQLKVVELTVWGGEHSPGHASMSYYMQNESRTPPSGMVQVKVFVNMTCTY